MSIERQLNDLQINNRFLLASSPSPQNPSDIHRVDAGGEVLVAAVAQLAEALGIEEGAVDGLALVHLAGFLVIRCAVGRVGHVKAKFLLLVHVATAMGAHVVEDVGALGVESHHGEVGVLLHELEGVARRSHIHGDGVDVFAPQVAQGAPADGHGVVVGLVAHGQQGTVPFEDGEGIALVVGHDVELTEGGVGCRGFGRGFFGGFGLFLGLVAAAGQGEGGQHDGGHDEVLFHGS